MPAAPEPFTTLPAGWDAEQIQGFSAMAEQRLIAIQHTQAEARRHPPATSLERDCLLCELREAEWLQGLLIDGWQRLRAFC